MREKEPADGVKARSAGFFYFGTISAGTCTVLKHVPADPDRK